MIMAAVVCTIACKKTNTLSKPPAPPPVDTTGTEPPPPPPPPKPVYLTRIQEGIDPDLSKDTVYHLVWKDSLRISMLVDSIKNDTLVADYNEAGYLTAITDKGAVRRLLSFERSAAVDTGANLGLRIKPDIILRTDDIHIDRTVPSPEPTAADTVAVIIAHDLIDIGRDDRGPGQPRRVKANL